MSDDLDVTTSLKLDEEAIAKAREQLEKGAVTPGVAPYAEEICKLLNRSLATEWVCVLRYRRHYFTTKGISSASIVDEFMEHAEQEMAHADKIAERIGQLGGEPELNPDKLTELSHADYDDSTDLKSMILANLVSERVAVEIYRQMIELIQTYDPTTADMLESILAEEEEHADDLSGWLDKA